jgi:lysophospholipase L1-like esterase
MTVWIVAVAAAAVGLLLLELGARWWIRRRSRYYVWPPRTKLELRLDREVFPDLEPRVRFEINTDGERGGEAPADESGLFRILAAGGSAVECYALDQPKTWPGLLERLLNEPERLDVLGAGRVHVGNIGHSGVGSVELDRILEGVLPQYRRLDAILIMVAASDVYHWLEEGAPPSRPPSVVPADLLFACHPAQRFAWTPSRSALAEVARRLRRLAFGQVEVKEHAGSWFAAARRMRAEATEVRTAMPDPAVVLSNFEHHFTRLIRRAQAHADRVIILRQPWFEKDYTAEERARFWHGGAGKPWKEKVSTYFGLEVVNRLLSLVEARVAAVADELGVPYLDLRPLLNGGLRHYYDHDHYTPAGAAVVAATVAAALAPLPPVRSAPLSRGPTDTAESVASGTW